MKTRLILCLILTTLSLSWSGCSTDDHLTPTLKSKELNLRYSILGADQILTYALPQEPHETQINNMYTLFFRGTDHASAGQFVGYTRTGTTSGATGNARVTMPADESVDDAWQLIFIANLEQYLDLNGDPNVPTWFANKIPAGTLIAAAQSELVGLANKKTGIKSSLLMSGEMLGAQQKPANTNIASVQLSRQVARIDVSNSDPYFTFETVQLWNARTQTYMSGTAVMTGIQGGAFENYDQNIINASAQGLVTAKLYAFANYVAVPSMTDQQTTCLIIGGRLSAAGGGSGNITYYRVNVSSPGGNQQLKKNGAYTININKVKSDGDTDPGDAYDKSQLKVDYKINEWDDSFNGMYIFDKDGNGLAVSQREVTFSDAGNQEVEIEVFTIPSATNPIAGAWSLDPVTGTNASEFSTAKIGSKVKITALSYNIASTDRTATQVVKWGTIELPVTLTQLNPTSSAKGLRLIPSSLWMPKISTTKQIQVDIQGNYAGITPADIETKIIYRGNPGSNGNTGWLTVTYVSDEAGIFTYDISVTNLSVVTPALTSRDAEIKFSVIQGTKILTALVTVRQTLTDETEEQENRQLMINCIYNGIDKGPTSTAYQLFRGLPNANSWNQLHFAINTKDLLKYKVFIRSGMTWEIKSNTQAVFNNLTFGKIAGGGDVTQPEDFLITAKSDQSTGMNAGWSGSFKITYENGDETEVLVSQQGVLAELPAYYAQITNSPPVLKTDDPAIYYYGTISIQNNLWLDRWIGAEAEGVSQTHDGNTINPKGQKLLDGTQASTACPEGYRPPSANKPADVIAMQNLFNALNKTDGTGIDTRGIQHPYKYTWFIELSTSPSKFHYLTSTPRVLKQTSGSGSIAYSYIAGLLIPYSLGIPTSFGVIADQSPGLTVEHTSGNYLNSYRMIHGISKYVYGQTLNNTWPNSWIPAVPSNTAITSPEFNERGVYLSSRHITSITAYYSNPGNIYPSIWLGVSTLLCLRDQ